MAIVAQRNGDERKVVAIIGDGAMTAGMAYEALNHAGGMSPAPNLLVILNDNRMSISEAVGGLTKMLGRATGSKALNAIREGGKRIFGDKKTNCNCAFFTSLGGALEGDVCAVDVVQRDGVPLYRPD